MSVCKYKRLNKVLGYGKYGTAFEAEADGKKYAINIFENEDNFPVVNPNSNFGKFKSDQRYSTFINPNEIDIPFRVRSPHLMQGEYLAEINECDYNSPAIVTKLYKYDLISNISILTFEEKRKILRGIFRGLQCLHKNKYLHLNCNLQNCLYGKDGEGVLIGYKYSAYSKEGINAGILTTQERILGEYKPPECIYPAFDNKFSYNNKSDIWSLGVLTYKLFTNNYNFLFQSIYDDLDDNKYKSLHKFQLEFMNEGTITDFIDEIIIPKIAEYHEEVMLPENKGQLRVLLMACLKIDPNKRGSAESILATATFLNVQAEPFICDFTPYQSYSLVGIEQGLFQGIYDIIEVFQKIFADKCVGVMFMALDLYLRFISIKKGKVSNIIETCCLSALKFFYWSELDKLNGEEIVAINRDEFMVRETRLYKALDGKVNEERYFSNAKSKKELIKVYETFIYPVNKDDTLLISDKEYGTFTINKFITNYLTEDPVAFFKRLDYTKVDNMHELTVNRFFNN